MEDAYDHLVSGPRTHHRRHNLASVKQVPTTLAPLVTTAAAVGAMTAAPLLRSQQNEEYANVPDMYVMLIPVAAAVVFAVVITKLRLQRDKNEEIERAEAVRQRTGMVSGKVRMSLAGRRESSAERSPSETPGSSRAASPVARSSRAASPVQRADPAPAPSRYAPKGRPAHSDSTAAPPAASAAPPGASPATDDAEF